MPIFLWSTVLSQSRQPLPGCGLVNTPKGFARVEVVVAGVVVVDVVEAVEVDVGAVEAGEVVVVEVGSVDTALGVVATVLEIDIF